MSSRPISIEFVADVAQYLRDVKRVEVSTDDVAEALVGVSNSADDLERKLSKAMRDSKDDVDLLTRAIKNIPDATDDAARKAGDDFGHLGDDLSETGREAGQEFSQNLAEGLSSGNPGQALTDTLFGLVSAVGSLPGVGTALVAAGATFAAGFQIIQGNADRAKQHVEDLFQALQDLTGTDFTKALQQEVLTDLGGGKLSEGLKKAKEWADALGVGVTDIVDIIDGDLTPANQDTLATLQQQYDTLLNQASTAEGLTGAQSDQLDVLGKILGVAKDNEKAYGGAASALATATDLAKDPDGLQNLTAEQFASNMQVVRDIMPVLEDSGKTFEEKMALAQQHAQEIITAFTANPLNATLRLYVDASALRQYFPYGVSGGQADISRIIGGFNPYGPKYSTP